MNESNDKALMKKYRAYLTRLTKAVAFETHVKRAVNADVVRKVMVKDGELPEYLDDGWKKRSFKPDVFEAVNPTLFNIKEDVDVPAKKHVVRPEWTGGVRPGEDVIGDTIAKLVDHVGESNPPWTSTRFLHPAWESVSEVCVASLKHARSRGVDKPLVPLQERAFADALKSDDHVIQTISLWFTNTRYHVEAYARLRLHANGDGELWSSDLELFKGSVTPANYPRPVDEALATVRGVLEHRGLLRARR